MRYLSLLTILMLPFLFSCGCSNQNDKEISLTKEEALEFINDNYKENAITPI